MDQLATLLIAAHAARNVGRTCRYEAPAGSSLGWFARRLRRSSSAAVVRGARKRFLLADAAR